MPNIEVDKFLNTKFPNLESLNEVDSVIHEIEDDISKSQNDHVDNSKNEINNSYISDPPLSKANEFLNQLKDYVKNPDDESIIELNKLIEKYGRVPAITYSKELVEQKLKLIKESEIRKRFVEILDELNDFEIFELHDLSNLDKSFDEKLKIYNKVSELRDEINDFKKSSSNINFHIDVNTNELYEEIELKLNEIVTGQLSKKLKDLLIPKLNDWDSDNSKNNLDSSTLLEFKLLLDLQLKSMQHTRMRAGSTITFWAIDCLVRKFQNKFIFHFEGNGETNRIDKPEFAFSYIVGYLRQNINHAKFLFASYFANSCKQNYPNNNEINIEGSFSTWFITSILIPLRKKLTKEISFLLDSNNNHLLSHVVSEVKKFDEEVKQEFAFIPIKGEEWGGLTNDLILNRDVVWNAWLKNEKDFVNKRFQEIVEMNDAFIIEYDLVEKGQTKPTKSAINLKNLLENITSNYETLPLKFQLKFLSEVQLKLLTFYYDTLKKGVNALKSIKNVEMEGVSTLERICRIWCSSKYIIEMMQKWSNEIIFVELWKSLNNGNPLQLETTFFESVIRNYEKEILDKIPSLLTKYFERQLNRTMKGYFEENSNWSLTEETTGNDNELDFVIQTLNKDQNYLQNTVSILTFNSWKLLLSNIVANYFEKNVALVNTFTPFGADKLERDVNHIFESLGLIKTFDQYKRLILISKILHDGKIVEDLTLYPVIDDSEASMLLMRRK